LRVEAPVVLDGAAREPDDDEVGEAPEGHEDNHSDGEAVLKGTPLKDAEVLEEEGEFDKGGGVDVDAVGKVEALVPDMLVSYPTRIYPGYVGDLIGIDITSYL
jgi:hypothetical protein